MKSVLYSGTIWHQRHSPIQHAFDYPIYFMALDLDELGSLSKKISCFGYNQTRLFSIWNRDYLGKSERPIKEKLCYWLHQYGMTEIPDQVLLLTMPRLGMYAFNPVNFYYCYRQDQSLMSIVVEINNTFGDKHLYILPAHENLSKQTSRYRFQRNKEFHVSPFNSLQGQYQFMFRLPADTLEVQINVQLEQKPFFTSGFSTQALPLNNKTLRQILIKYPFTIWSTTLKIGYQAFRLYFFHKLSVFDHPKPPSRWTIQQEKPLFLQSLLTGDYLEWIHQKIRPSQKEIL